MKSGRSGHISHCKLHQSAVTWCDMLEENAKRSDLCCCSLWHLFVDHFPKNLYPETLVRQQLRTLKQESYGKPGSFVENPSRSSRSSRFFQHKQDFRDFHPDLTGTKLCRLPDDILHTTQNGFQGLSSTALLALALLALLSRQLWHRGVPCLAMSRLFDCLLQDGVVILQNRGHGIRHLPQPPGKHPKSISKCRYHVMSAKTSPPFGRRQSLGPMAMKKHCSQLFKCRCEFRCQAVCMISSVKPTNANLLC